MTGTLDKNERRYMVTVSLNDGTQFSFGVAVLGDVLQAARERTDLWEIGYYMIVEEKVTRPTVLAGRHHVIRRATLGD